MESILLSAANVRESNDVYVISCYVSESGLDINHRLQMCLRIRGYQGRYRTVLSSFWYYARRRLICTRVYPESSVARAIYAFPFPETPVRTDLPSSFRDPFRRRSLHPRFLASALPLCYPYTSSTYRHGNSTLAPPTCSRI